MKLYFFKLFRITSILCWLFIPMFAHAAGLCQGIVIPAYFYPGSLWTAAINSAPKTAIIIMNPNSGPGSSQDLAYLNAVRSAQAAGIKVLGYVYTGYGNRPMLNVTTDIKAYKTWYGVDGIFLDETNYYNAYLSYYKKIANYIRSSKGGFVMINPGTVPAEGYIRLADTTIVFEDNYLTYQGWKPPFWLYKYPAGKLTHLVYNVPNTTALNTAINLSRSRNAGLVYFTDDKLNNPWDRLPSYWSTELSALTAKCYP